MAVTDVLDFTAGTGGAAAAALHCGIKYEGICVNADQKKWLESLMDKVVYAVACDSPEHAAAVGASTELVNSIKLFYQGTVKEAKRYLSAQSSDMPAAGHDDAEDGGGGGGQQRREQLSEVQPSLATGTSDSV